MTSDPKEALERLKLDVDRAVQGPDGLVCVAYESDLRTLIAKQEGLEREVERLAWLAQRRFEHKVEARTRMEAAESKLSALTEAARDALSLMKDSRNWGIIRQDFEALLHPTVPAGATKPGLGWKLSDEGKAALDALDQAQAAGVRAVLEHPEHFIVGSAAVPVQEGAGLVEQLDAAILGLNPLTGFGEDHVWRPADRARKALIEARDRLSTKALTTYSHAEAEAFEQWAVIGLFFLALLAGAGIEGLARVLNWLAERQATSQDNSQ